MQLIIRFSNSVILLFLFSLLLFPGKAQAQATIIVEDTFTRSTSNGWGTADTGGAYTILGGTASNFSVNGSSASISQPIGNQTITISPTALDTEMVFRFQLDKLPTGGNVWITTIMRRNGNNEYRPRMTIGANGAISLQTIKNVGGTTSQVNNFSANTAINSGNPLIPNTWYYFKARVTGTNPTTIQSRVWQDGSAEPGTWTFEQQDSEAVLQNSGFTGVRTDTQGAVTNPPVVMSFDDYIITDLNPLPTNTPTPSLTPTPTPYQVFEDTFTRSLTDDWGYADTGQQYTYSSGVSDYDVTGTKGSMVLTSATTNRIVYFPVTLTESESLLLFEANKLPTGSGYFISLYHRVQSNGDHYRLRVNIPATNLPTLQAVKSVSGSINTIGSAANTGLTFQANTQYYLRTRVSGTSPTSLQAKFWEFGTSEPLNWTLTQSDSDVALQTSGTGALRSDVSSASNLPVTFLFDSLTQGSFTPDNAAPLVSAGSDKVVTLPSSVILNGSVTDDNIPVGSPLTYEWSQISGPVNANFSNTQTLSPSVTFPQSGTYIFRLTATDTDDVSTDDVTVTVFSTGTASTESVEATDDTKVRKLQPSATYGNDPLLRFNYYDYDTLTADHEVVYLKFDLTDPSFNNKVLTDAKLNFRLNASNQQMVSIKLLPDTGWDENTLTYTDIQIAGYEPLYQSFGFPHAAVFQPITGSTNFNIASRDVTIDLTENIETLLGESFTITIESMNGKDLSVYSKENTSSQPPPQLTLQLEDAPTPAAYGTLSYDFDTVALPDTTIEINPLTQLNNWDGLERNPNFAPAVDAYKRYLWSSVEPSDDVFDFSVIENDINAFVNGAPGRKYAFRLRMMRSTGNDLPAFMQNSTYTISCKQDDSSTFDNIPNWNNPQLIAEHEKLINALAAEYNDDPRVIWIDIGAYGNYGEWQNGSYDSDNNDPNCFATTETKETYIDQYNAAFPDTFLQISAVDDEPARYVLSLPPSPSGRYIGLRRDCFGRPDLYCGSSINRDFDVISSAIDLWKYTPYVAEFFNPSAHTYPETYRVARFEAANTRMAVLGNGNTINNWNLLDTTSQNEFNLLGMSLGYKYRIRNVSLYGTIQAGETATATLTISNIGNTPTYEPWEVLLQLRDQNTDAVIYEEDMSIDLKALLPTYHLASNEDTPVTYSHGFSIPQSVVGGTYDLHVIVKDSRELPSNDPNYADKEFNNPRNPMYIGAEGRESEGSYLLGPVTVQAEATPTETPTPTPTDIPPPTPTDTPEPTVTLTPTLTPTLDPGMPTETPVPPTLTPTPTALPMPTSTPVATQTPAPTAQVTSAPPANPQPTGSVQGAADTQPNSQTSHIFIKQIGSESVFMSTEKDFEQRSYTLTRINNTIRGIANRETTIAIKLLETGTE